MRPRLAKILPPPRPSLAERTAQGKSLRARFPRKEQGLWEFDPRGDDFLDGLKSAVAGRRTDLLPIRWGRMVASPFGFLRGTAHLMAGDLGRRPAIPIEVQVCGDAHLFNLGAYAAPDGHLVFDINDFDETCRGSFEWDLKRLVASCVVGGRSAGEKEGACRTAVQRLARAYRESLAHFSGLRVLELARFEITPRTSGRPLAPIFRRAARNTPHELIRRSTLREGSGFSRFKTDPPLMVPLKASEAKGVLLGLEAYRGTLGPARKQAFDAYAPWDLAFRVVGTGSVGVEDYLVLLYGTNADDPLFLQVKEADASCWQPYTREHRAALATHHGRRVAEGQQRTQTVVDPFLGFTAFGGKTFLVRQWSDHKATADVRLLAQGGAFLDYASLCGEVLAKAHARTGDAAVLCGYCGRGEAFVLALEHFAFAYADQVEADHARFKKAVKKGIFRAEKA